MNQTRVILLAIAVLALGGCSTQLRNTTTSDVALLQSDAVFPRPQRVVVVGFTSDSTQVQLDRGIGARLQRTIGSSEISTQQSALANKVRSAVIDTLVGDLSKMGFAAERVRPGEALRPGDLVVQGQIVLIDQGNRTRRLALGFGAGKSEVRAAIQVYAVGPDLAFHLLQTYSAVSNSGRKPGLVLGGAGIVAQGSAIPLTASVVFGASSEVRKAGVAGEGQRLAHRIADELGQFFVAQGWVEPSRPQSLAQSL